MDAADLLFGEISIRREVTGQSLSSASVSEAHSSFYFPLLPSLLSGLHYSHFLSSLRLSTALFSSPFLVFHSNDDLSSSRIFLFLIFNYIVKQYNCADKSTLHLSYLALLFLLKLVVFDIGN